MEQNESMLVDESFPTSLVIDSTQYSGRFSDFGPNSRRPSGMFADTSRDSPRRSSEADLTAPNASPETPFDSSSHSDSHQKPRSRPLEQITLTRSRSKSMQDFVSLNKKKFPHVESKVKKMINQMNATNPIKRVSKQKSMPELQSEGRGICSPDEESKQDFASISKALEIQVYKLKDLLENAEANLEEARLENLALKRKIEDMRGKLFQLSERRSSAPMSFSSALDLRPFDLYHSQRRPKKLVHCSVQTVDEESEFLVRSATISGLTPKSSFFTKRGHQKPIFIADSGVQTEVSSFQIFLEDEVPPPGNKRSLNRIFHSFEKSDSSYHIFEDSSAVSTPVEPDREAPPSKKKWKLSKLLHCACFP